MTQTIHLRTAFCSSCQRLRSPVYANAEWPVCLAVTQYRTLLLAAFYKTRGVNYCEIGSANEKMAVPLLKLIRIVPSLANMWQRCLMARLSGLQVGPQ